MKIKLQEPFSKDFKSGYLLTNKEPRNLILLVRFDNTKTSISYARYLMSCFLKRYLLKEEQVDHIDNNRLNDTIDNLQIISQKENIIKSNAFYNIKKRYETFTCPICKKEFTVAFNKVTTKLKNNPNYKPCCSRSCGGKKSHATSQVQTL